MGDQDQSYDGTQAREVVGRLVLWQISLLDCERFLTLAERAQAAGRLPLYRARNEGHVVDVLQPPRARFPTGHECGAIVDATASYAVVAFMRMFNKGFPAPGLALGNMTAAARAERELVVSAAFPGDEREVFDALLKQVENARDQFLAHSDASTHGVVVEPGALGAAVPFSSVDQIDLDQLKLAAAKLGEEVGSRIAFYSRRGVALPTVGAG
jgi:hypothetical protein